MKRFATIALVVVFAGISQAAVLMDADLSSPNNLSAEQSLVSDLAPSGPVNEPIFQTSGSTSWANGYASFTMWQYATGQSSLNLYANSSSRLERIYQSIWFYSSDPSEFNFNMQAYYNPGLQPTGLLNYQQNVGIYTADGQASAYTNARDEWQQTWSEKGGGTNVYELRSMLDSGFSAWPAALTNIGLNYGQYSYTDEGSGVVHNVGYVSLTGNGSFGEGSAGDAKGLAFQEAMNAVPEPSALAFLGLGALAFIRRR